MHHRLISSALFLASALGAQVGPSTDVWIAPLTQNGGAIKLGAPRNLTHRAGYDNQPSFTPKGDAILYTVVGADAQADIWRMALPNGVPKNLTNTPESEYSATVVPDGRSYSVIRVEADSTQRLWRFPLDGQGSPSLILEKIKPVGYHLWVADHTLVLYMLGASRGPATLQLADDRTGTAEIVGTNIGRALGKVPGRDAVTFQQLVKDSSSWISELDLRTKQTRRLFKPPAGADYHVWTPGGALLAAAGSKVYLRTDRGWDVAADLAPWGVKNITRLAISPRGDWLAFVAEDRPSP